MYAKRPRHCVPHAIVQFKTKRKQAQAKIQPVSVPVVRILFINILNLLKGYLRYKTILCHKVALDMQLINFLI